jgi:hypothetical protein
MILPRGIFKRIVFNICGQCFMEEGKAHNEPKHLDENI